VAYKRGEETYLSREEGEDEGVAVDDPTANFRLL